MEHNVFTIVLVICLFRQANKHIILFMWPHVSRLSVRVFTVFSINCSNCSCKIWKLLQNYLFDLGIKGKGHNDLFIIHIHTKIMVVGLKKKMSESKKIKVLIDIQCQDYNDLIFICTRNVIIHIRLIANKFYIG
jgi:hypothetical protein